MGAVLHNTGEKIEVRGVTTDSRPVREGDLFFALRGTSAGADYAQDAPRVGAVAAAARRVGEGALFFALRGASDGAGYAQDALGRGAVAAVASRPLAGP